jgi:phage tail sheath protein FI
MPVKTTYPGVYIQEVPSGVHTITGVSTSIAAFLGRASKGPINKAVRIQSLADYARQFGDPHSKSDLADSVRLFFGNGGTDSYVIRLAKGAKKAGVTLKSLGGDDVLEATAKAEGTWGNTVRLQVDYDSANPNETFNLYVILEEGGQAVTTESHLGLTMDPDSPRFAPTFVTQSSDLIDLELTSTLGPVTDATKPINDITKSFAGFSQSRRPLGTTAAEVRTTFDDLVNPSGTSKPAKLSISVNDKDSVTVDLSPWNITGSTTLTDLETHLESVINPALQTIDPGLSVDCELTKVGSGGNAFYLLFIQADTTVPACEPWASVRVSRASKDDITAALMLGIDQGGMEFVRWSDFRPAPTASVLKLGTIPSIASPISAPEDLTENLDEIALLNQSDITQITIDSKPVMLNTTDYDLVTVTVGTPLWYQSAVDPASPTAHEDNDGVREKLKIMANAINADTELNYRAKAWGYQFSLMATSGTINKTPASIATDDAAFDADEIQLNVRQYTLGSSGTGSFSTPGQSGDDGSAPTVSEYLGDQDKQTGFYALDSVDLFNLMVLPGDVEVKEADFQKIVGPASNYCAEQRAFLIIDSPASWVEDDRPKVVQDTSKVNDLRALVNKTNSAVFYPHLKYASGSLTKKIGPAGAIAGLMARIDATRGVWKAPAGIEADLRNILGLDLKLTDMENGVLNQLGVNCLRTFPSGFVCWGSRTMAGSDDLGSEWKYIPIRRFALFLEESLFRGTKWIVFEPNDEPLWAKIRQNINAFMMGLFRQGAFQGSTPDKAFYVKCDAETTTQADRNLGIVNIEVGFAPLKPAEFVVIKIQQMAGDL